VTAGPALLEGSFVDRPNRFVVVIDLADGRRVRAHLPNTGRLTHVTQPGTRYMLEPVDDPKRVTRFTATRAWDGCWVALDASRAPSLLADWLAGNELPGFGPVGSLEREVGLGRRRIDLVAHTPGGAVWLEVKSGGRAQDGRALLSQTPSSRAAAQLGSLSEVVAAGAPAAVAFVVQRPDVETLLIEGDADRGWIESVTKAARAGVALLAFGCAVTHESVWIDRQLPITWAE